MNTLLEKQQEYSYSFEYGHASENKTWLGAKRDINGVPEIRGRFDPKSLKF